MGKYKLFILLNLVLFLSSCGTVKEGFSSQKTNNSDEFLVEKKSPLVMPPDYNELPIPKTNNIENNKGEEEIKSLFSETIKGNENSDASEDINKTFEDSLLDKIKNN